MAAAVAATAKTTDPRVQFLVPEIQGTKNRKSGLAVCVWCGAGASKSWSKGLEHHASVTVIPGNCQFGSIVDEFAV